MISSTNLEVCTKFGDLSNSLHLFHTVHNLLNSLVARCVGVLVERIAQSQKGNQ